MNESCEEMFKKMISVRSSLEMLGFCSITKMCTNYNVFTWQHLNWPQFWHAMIYWINKTIWCNGFRNEVITVERGSARSLHWSCGYTDTSRLEGISSCNVDHIGRSEGTKSCNELLISTNLNIRLKYMFSMN